MRWRHVIYLYSAFILATIGWLAYWFTRPRECGRFASSDCIELQALAALIVAALAWITLVAATLLASSFDGS